MDIRYKEKDPKIRNSIKRNKEINETLASIPLRNIEVSVGWCSIGDTVHNQ